MRELLSSFGLASPLLLLALPFAIAALVYAYRQRGRGVRRVVASLFLLKSLTRPHRAPKQFLPPPRFFFDLLIILLLLLGAAGFFRKNAGERIGIVLDNSLSMQAQLGATGDAFKAALADARAYLATLPSSAQIQVWTTSPVLREVSVGKVSPSQAIELMRSLTTAWGDDQIEQVVATLVRREELKRVIVFTDRPIATAEKVKGIRLEVRSRISSAAAPGNISISNAVFEQDTRTLRTEVSSFSRESVPFILEVDAFQKSSQRFVRIAKAQGNIYAQGRTEVAVSSIPADADAMRIRISPDLRAGQTLYERNVLEADDVAFIVANAVGSEILFVGELSPRELGLEQIPGFSFKWLRLNEYEEKGLPQGVTPVVFHRVAPLKLPSRSTFLIDPPANNPLFPATPTAGKTRVVRWLGTHPVLSYLRLDDLSIPQASVLLPQAWMRELVTVAEGPILLEGESAGTRSLVLGLEALPFEGKRSPQLSIFLLNALRWLSGASAGASFERVHTQLPVGAGVSRAYYLAGKEVYRRADQALASISADQPGIVAFEGDRQVALNFFSSSESDYTATRSIMLESDGNALASVITQEPWTWKFALLALLLLALDLIVMLWRVPKGA